MCLLVLVGADKRLSEIPWDAASPSFFVSRDVPPDAGGMAELIEKRHVYYAGSHEQCGCAFAWQDFILEDEERAASQASLAALVSYLKRALAYIPELEIGAAESGTRPSAVVPVERSPEDILRSGLSADVPQRIIVRGARSS